MGNALCFRTNGYIIDYTHRKIVISQGVQCSLLMPASCCPHVSLAQPVCSPQRHCHCGVIGSSGDVIAVHNSNPNLNKKTEPLQPMTLKSKTEKITNRIRHENNDALVSLSETVSESSMEDFLNRKRNSLNLKKNVRGIKIDSMMSLSEDKTVRDFDTTLLNNEVSSSLDGSANENKAAPKNKKNRRKNRTRKRQTQNTKNNDTTSTTSLSTPNSIVGLHVEQQNVSNVDLNNSAEIISYEDSRKSSETLCSPQLPTKSILKNTENLTNGIYCEATNENVQPLQLTKPNIKNQSISMLSDDYSTHTYQQRSISAMSNHDSLDQLMSLLRSSTTLAKEQQQTQKKSQSNDCLNKFQNSKCVNFASDIRSPRRSTYKNNDESELSDGRIKKRFILRETHKLFEILNDPSDRRIRSICDRHQCDLEIFVRPPKIGLMYFAVEIIASNKYSLRMCVRELDSSMKWCISSQLF